MGDKENCTSHVGNCERIKSLEVEMDGHDEKTALLFQKMDDNTKALSYLQLSMETMNHTMLTGFTTMNRDMENLKQAFDQRSEGFDVLIADSLATISDITDRVAASEVTLKNFEWFRSPMNSINANLSKCVAGWILKGFGIFLIVMIAIHYQEIGARILRWLTKQGG